MKPRIREVIVVEGRYDRNALLQAVDAAVVGVGGFALFNDREKAAYLRRLAEARGVILLTDPDGAGFVLTAPTPARLALVVEADVWVDGVQALLAALDTDAGDGLS